MGNTSTLRTLIEDELHSRGSSLAEFIVDGRSKGESMKQLTVRLVDITRIPISWRTLYRWTADIEEKAS